MATTILIGIGIFFFAVIIILVIVVKSDGKIDVGINTKFGDIVIKRDNRKSDNYTALGKDDFPLS